MNAISQSQQNSGTLTEVERQFQQVDISIFGRYMLEDKREFPCQIINMSPGSASVVGPRSGEVGETVIAYMDHIGRLEGKVLRIFHGGFAMSVNATPQKRDKLSAQITWLANRHELNLPEDRRHERFVPNKKIAQIKLEDGREYSAKIVDLSLSGAAIKMDVRPAIGTLMWLGNMRGRVVRHFEDGVAIEFSIVQDGDSLKQFTASDSSF
ncbi:MAG: PilZ domain-containing protein [Pseudomonadota bacterium]